MHKPASEENGEGPPAWIVSFSDMVTLLLAFFVLLQAFSHVQDPELFFVGRDAFKRAVAGLGIPGWLLGKEENVRQDYLKTRSPTEEAEHKIPKNRVLDAQDEDIRQAFDAVEKSMATETSQVADRLVERRAMSLAFAGSAQSLTGGAAKALSDFALTLRQNMRYRAITVHVIGLSSEPGDAEERLTVSSLRAKAVAEALADACSQAAAEFGWQFTSWGAGAGGKWLESTGRVPEGTNTVVVITERQ
jgi:flagellar motor protein MotB